LDARFGRLPVVTATRPIAACGSAAAASAGITFYAQRLGIAYPHAFRGQEGDARLYSIAIANESMPITAFHNLPADTNRSRPVAGKAVLIPSESAGLTIARPSHFSRDAAGPSHPATRARVNERA
jgi:hypothetical protein